ncbi:MAG: transposase, partial [Lachnospiraceae bacterium]|nr:transposase [Lachnospiraceae bacterium]
LLVLESSLLKEKAAASLEKRRMELEPEIKKVEKKVFLCQADAEKEIRRFEKLPCTGLFDCEFSVEKEVREKWPRGRRKADTVPKIEERYHLKSGEISVKEKERDEYLQKASCIVLISNVDEEEQGDIELVRIYKGQQVVENSFRELKSPSMASVIYLKNPERIKALSMLLSLALLIRAIIQ